MGQGHPTQFSNKSLKTFQNNYVFVSEKSDERWGTVQVWKEKGSHNHVMLVSKNFHNDGEFKAYLEELKPRSASQHPNLLTFIGWSNEDSDGICGHSRKFHLYCEYLSQNLDKEIKRRAVNKEFFEESELWYLARSTIVFGGYLQEQGLFHGDIRPSQLLLTEGEHDDGQIKLADNGLIGQFRNNYQLTFSGAAKGYLAPQQLRAYAKREPNPEYDVYRADVFSLGVTLLHAASLKDPHTHVYDWVAKEFNYKSVERLFEELRTRYSPQFIDFLGKLLEEEESRRLDFHGLAGFVQLGGSQAVQKPSFIPPLQGSYRPPVIVPPTNVSGYTIPQGYNVPLQGSAVYYNSPIVGSQNLPPVTYSQGPVNLGGSTLNYPPPQSGVINQSYAQPMSRPLYSSQNPGGYGGIKYVSQASPVKRFENVEDLSDLDRRVQEAIRTTEETINRNSQIPNLVETQQVEPNSQGLVENLEGNLVEEQNI